MYVQFTPNSKVSYRYFSFEIAQGTSPIISRCNLIFQGSGLVQICLPPEGMFVAQARVGMHPHATSKIDASQLNTFPLPSFFQFIPFTNVRDGNYESYRLGVAYSSVGLEFTIRINATQRPYERRLRGLDCC